MQCPTCFNEFKNYNSCRVHRWRFHNPHTKYGQTITRETSETDPYPSLNDTDTASVIPAMASAGVGVAAIAGNNWKRWLIIIIVIVAALAFLVWYFVIRKADDANVSS